MPILLTSKKLCWLWSFHCACSIRGRPFFLYGSACFHQWPPSWTTTTIKGATSRGHAVPSTIRYSLWTFTIAATIGIIAFRDTDLFSAKNLYQQKFWHLCLLPRCYAVQIAYERWQSVSPTIITGKMAGTPGYLSAYHSASNAKMNMQRPEMYPLNGRAQPEWRTEIARSFKCRWHDNRDMGP